MSSSDSPVRTTSLILGLAIGGLLVGGLWGWYYLAKPADAPKPNGTPAEANRAQDDSSASETSADSIDEAARPRPATTSAGPPPTSGTLPDLSSFVDKSAAKRVWPDISVRLPAVTETVDIQAVTTVLLDREDEDLVRHEAANLLRRSDAPDLVDHLNTILNREDEVERMRAYAIQHLSMTIDQATYADKRATTIQTITRHLDDRQLAVRRESFLALSQLRHESAGRLIGPGLSAQGDPAMRDLYIRAAHAWDRQEHLVTIRGFLDDEEDLVATAAIYVVGQWRDQASRERLATIADASPSRIRRSAATFALRQFP